MSKWETLSFVVRDKFAWLNMKDVNIASHKLNCMQIEMLESQQN